MKQSYQLAFIGTPTAESAQLYQLVAPIAQANNFNSELITINEAQEYVNICANFDAVILDATLEPNGHHNYRFALPNPAYHILVVSRKSLPLNFYGMGDSFPYQRENDCRILYRHLGIWRGIWDG